MIQNFDNLEVFVLTYNRAAFLKVQLESLCEQSANGFKIRILNNASTDDTEEVVKEIQKRYPDREIELITHEKNIGNPNNFKKTQELASREYCAVFHDDDIIHPDYLKTAMTIFMNEPSVVVCSCQIEMSDAPSNVTWKEMNFSHYTWSEENSCILSLLCGRLNFCTAIYKTSVYKTVSYHPEMYGKLFDIPFLNDIGMKGDTVFIKSIGAIWRQHKGQDSNTLSSGPFPNDIINVGLNTKRILGNHKLLRGVIIYDFMYFLFEWSRIRNMSWETFLRESCRKKLFSPYFLKIVNKKIIYYVMKKCVKIIRKKNAKITLKDAL